MRNSRQLYQRLQATLAALVFPALLMVGVAMPSVASAQGVATIMFGQSSVTKQVNTDFSVNISIDPNGETVDTARIILSYPPEYLIVTNFTLDGTLPDKSPGSSYNNETGKLSWGGFTTEGGITKKGQFGTVTFRALKEGDAVVTLSPSSHLIGNGEEKINYASLGQVNVSITTPESSKLEAVPEPSATPPSVVPTGQRPAEEVSAIKPVEIASASMPDQNTWYTADTVAVSWTRPTGVNSFKVGISRDPEAAPDVLVRDTGHVFPHVSDGVWYVAVAPRFADLSMGATARYRVQIDGTKPHQFVPILEALRIEGGDQVLLKALFGAIDDTSGIAYYQTRVDGQDFQVAESPFAIRVGVTDKVQFTVRAYDKAGNYQQNTSEMVIDLKQLATISPQDIPGARLLQQPASLFAWQDVWADYRWSVALLGGVAVALLGWAMSTFMHWLSASRRGILRRAPKKKKWWLPRDRDRRT